MFELDRFIADCHDAVTADPTHRSVREVVAGAVSDPASVLAGLGEPRMQPSSRRRGRGAQVDDDQAGPRRRQDPSRACDDILDDAAVREGQQHNVAAAHQVAQR